MGASVPNNVKDEDLDRHVADLIIKEAKQRAEKYAQQGIQAYLPAHGYVALILLLTEVLKRLTVLKPMCPRPTNGFCRL